MRPAPKILMKCQCCGHEELFADADEAFHAGWDCPPFFPYTACNLCPGVCAIGMASHKMAHALWEEHGRPRAWSIETCASDAVLKDPAAKRRAKVAMRKISAVFKKIRREEKAS